MSYSQFTSLPILLRSRKLRVIPMISDGNCFYRAISTALFKNPEYHTDIRHKVTQYIQQHSDKYSIYFENSRYFFRALLANNYPGVWNSDFADMIPHAVAQMFEVRIEIYAEDSFGKINKYVLDTNRGTKSPLRLLLRNDHYDLLQK